MRSIAASARAIALRSRHRDLSERAARYERFDDKAIVDWQLRRLDTSWRGAWTTVPFYAWWRREHDLPRQIHDLTTFEQFPVLTKKILQDRHELVFAHANPGRVYSTGGSTGRPTRFPRGGGEEAVQRYSTGALARLWWGFEPGDLYVHLWGHSAQIGKGVRATYRRRIRRMQDIVVGAHRLSAYDLSEEALLQQWSVISRVRPDYLVGYTSALVRLTKFAVRAGLRPDSASLKFVQVSAETLSEDDAARLEEFWQAPIITEYGSAELGPVAASRGGTWPLQVLWDSILIQAEGRTPLMSSLHDRIFPLFRYDVGDEVDVLRQMDGSVLTLDRVQGRAQDVLRIPLRGGGDIAVHALLIVHIAKRDDRVHTCQVQQSFAAINVYLTGSFTEDDLPVIRKDLLERLAEENASLAGAAVNVTRLAVPWLSPAGKQLAVVPESIAI